MKGSKTIELGIIFFLIIISLYFWTLPFQKNRLPFGDVDSSTHFTLADSMSQTNKPINYLPAQFNNTYYLKTNNGKLWYFPQYHTGAAIFQLMSGRFVGAYLFFALMSILIVLTSFILIKELFGLLPAAISSFWLVFSSRDILWYILGVYPQVASFGMVPLFLYCTYKYVTSHLEKEPKQIYAFAGAVIIALQFFVHPQAVFISGLTAAIFGFVMIAKHKKIPFDIKHAGIGIAIIIVLVLPFIGFFTTVETEKTTLILSELPSLFKWYGTPESGMPQQYYSFTAMHGFFLLPLAIIGVILMLLRRKDEDLLMLSWLFAYYVALHMSLFGWHRNLRFMEVEAHILVPIAVVGVLRLPSLIPMQKNAKNIARIVLSAILIISIVTFAVNPAHAILKNAFEGTARITPAQLGATEWIKDKTNVQDTFYLLGTSTYTKKKWMRVLSLRQTNFKNENEFSLSRAVFNHSYAIFDYSDWIAAYGGLPEPVAALQAEEISNFNQSRPVYSKDNIRVYKIG